MFLKNGLIVILVLSFTMNLMAIELFLLKSNDGDEKKYAFILTGRNGEDYGFIVKCPTPAQERSVLKSLFNNPHPIVERKNNLTYSDFNNAKKLDAGEFIRLCPDSDNRESIDLFSDRTIYYMHFFESTDNSMYLTVKSKRVVKGFGLDPEKAQIVSKSFFKKANLLTLESGPEASNYRIDAKNQAIKIYVENDENIKADVSVILHLKSKSGKNDRMEVLDPLEDISIYKKIFYTCSSGKNSTCEIVIPYGQVIEKLNDQLDDTFEVDRIDDIRFENIVAVDEEVAANRFHEENKNKHKPVEVKKEEVPVVVKKTKEQEIEQKLMQSNRHINTASKEIRLYPELDDSIKADIEVTVQLKSKSGKNDRNLKLQVMENVYIFKKQHYLCNKSTEFGCEVKIPYGDLLKKLAYQINDSFDVVEIDTISFKNIILVDDKVPLPIKPIVTPIPKQIPLPESEDELREEKSRLYKEWQKSLYGESVQKKSEIEGRIALIDIKLAEIQKKFKKSNEVKVEKPKIFIVRGHEFTDIDKAEKKKKDVWNISGSGNFAGAIVVGKCNLCDSTNEKNLGIGEHTIYSSQKRALSVPCSYCKDGKVMFHSPAFKKCWYRIKGKRSNSTSFETEWRKCDRENTTMPIKAYSCTDDSKDYFDEVVIETAPLE